MTDSTKNHQWFVKNFVRAAFLLSFVLLALKIFSFPVFAETVTVVPDPLPDVIVGNRQTFSVGISGLVVGKTYSVNFGDSNHSPNPMPGAVHFAQPGDTVINFNNLQTDPLMVLGTNTVAVVVWGQAGTLATRYFKTIPEPLPDLYPSNFSACLRQREGAPGFNNVYITAWEKNKGNAPAGQHISRIELIDIDPECVGLEHGPRDAAVPALAPGAEYKLYYGELVFFYNASCGTPSVRYIIDLKGDVRESDTGNNVKTAAIPDCPISCGASFNPTSGVVVQGKAFDLKGKINYVAGGNGTGFDFMWARKYGPGNYVYPPTINPTQVNVLYPGRWNSAGVSLGTYKLVFIAKNKNRSWNYAVTCGGESSIKVIK